MEPKYIVAIAGILAIAGINITGLVMGLNGQLTAGCLTLIGGIIGAIFGVTIGYKTNQAKTLIDEIANEK